MPVTHQSNAESIEEIGGQALEQSGFENETPDSFPNASVSEPEIIEEPSPSEPKKEAGDVD